MPLFGAPQGIAAALAGVGQFGRMQLESAQTRLVEQQLREKEIEARAMQQFAAQSALGANGKSEATPKEASSAPQSLGARLASEGLFLLKSGAPTAGMAMLKEAGAFETKEMQRQKYSMDIQRGQLAVEKGRADWVARQLATFDPKAVDAPQRWRQINLEYEQQFREPSPYTNLPYSPQLVQQIESATMSYKDHLDEQMKNMNYQEKVSHDASIERSSAIRAAATAQRAAIAGQREARLAKVGGKAAMAADKGMIAEAKRMAESINAQNPDTAAYNIASEAAIIAQHNPGLTRSEAVHRAFAEAQNRGEFSGVPPSGIASHLPSAIAGYLPGAGAAATEFATGDSPAMAIPVPDKAALAGKKDVWVKTPKGVFWWDGKRPMLEKP